MTTERPPITKEKCGQLGREHWRKLNGNRSYAGTPDVDIGIGAIAFAWYEDGGSFASHEPDEAETFDKFLSNPPEVRPKAPPPRKNRGEPQKLPQLWTHPLTNQPLPPPKGPDER